MAPGHHVTDRHCGVTVRYGMVHRRSAADEHLRGQFRRFGRRGWTDGVVVVPRTSRSSYNRLGPRPPFRATWVKVQNLEERTEMVRFSRGGRS